VALEDYRPRHWARRLLDDARRGLVPLTPDGWFDATIYATGGRIGPDDKPIGGDREAAQAAFNRAVLTALKNNQPTE
jgi:hypothetical protein